jgi:hypothetical protein
MYRRMTLSAILLIAAVLRGGPQDIVQARVTDAGTNRIALLDSATTKRFFGLHYPPCSPPNSYYLGADEYQRYFRGWEFVLQRFGFDYDIVYDDDIANGALANYRVLILSNTAALSIAEMSPIVGWVRGGGRLIATFGSGYKSDRFDPNQADRLALSQSIPLLWGDPFTTTFSTSSVTTSGVDIHINGYYGPTAGLANQLVNNVLHYGANGNLLMLPAVRRSVTLATLIINNPQWQSQPAILGQTQDRGVTVYFAFAPEYLVSKEFGLPAPEQCPDGQVWAGRSHEGMLLMESTLRFMTQ